MFHVDLDLCMYFSYQNTMKEFIVILFLSKAIICSPKQDCIHIYDSCLRDCIPGTYCFGYDCPPLPCPEYEDFSGSGNAGLYDDTEYDVNTSAGVQDQQPSLSVGGDDRMGDKGDQQPSLSVGGDSTTASHHQPHTSEGDDKMGVKDQQPSLPAGGDDKMEDKGDQQPSLSVGGDPTTASHHLLNTSAGGDLSPDVYFDENVGDGFQTLYFQIKVCKIFNTLYQH